MNFNPLRLGIIAAVVAVGMWLTDVLWRPVFTLEITDTVSIPLWVLAAIYAVLQLWIWNNTREKLELTDEEVEEWGPKLEEATPDILEQWEAHTPAKDIAERVEQRHGIPPQVTLRYMIALGRYVEGQKAGGAQ
ncbi:MAG: hypothetical protein ACQEXJ_12835 [Myxococcota bacterium]